MTSELVPEIPDGHAPSEREDERGSYVGEEVSEDVARVVDCPGPVQERESSEAESEPEGAGDQEKYFSKTEPHGGEGSGRVI